MDGAALLFAVAVETEVAARFPTSYPEQSIPRGDYPSKDLELLQPKALKGKYHPLSVQTRCASRLTIHRPPLCLSRH